MPSRSELKQKSCGDRPRGSSTALSGHWRIVERKAQQKISRYWDKNDFTKIYQDEIFKDKNLGKFSDKYFFRDQLRLNFMKIFVYSMVLIPYSTCII